MKKSFKVTVSIPNGCTVEEMRQYILYSVRSFRGGYDKSEPLFKMNPNKVSVRPFSSPKIPSHVMRDIAENKNV